MKHILGFDFGTGGCRATVFSEIGEAVCSVFEAIPTRYPTSYQHVQSPETWVEAMFVTGQTVVKLAREERQIEPGDILAIGIGGHCHGVVPLDAQGRLLRSWVPIWSDSRSLEQVQGFFTKFDEDTWYRRTGCGHPPANYPLFKLLWYWDNEPGMFSEIATVLGTKDFLNYHLTGAQKTDFSYAAGSGCWNLTENSYDGEILANSGLNPSIFPEAVASTEIIGTLTSNAAERLGLSTEVRVVAGGADNACAALGAGCHKNGQLAASLGSCSWVAVSSDAPLLDSKIKPFVLPHVVLGQFLNSSIVFSTGTTLLWMKRQLCGDLIRLADETGRNRMFLMADEAKKSVIGANGVVLSPAFAGPSNCRQALGLHGAFLGLSLAHTRADLIRATYEGVAIELKWAFDSLRTLCSPKGQIRIVGNRMPELILHIYSNILDHDIVTCENGQTLPAFGAAALAAVGTGLWRDFDSVELASDPTEKVTEPDGPSVMSYRPVLYRYKKAAERLNQLADDWDAEVYEIE